jgi:hypothetical protein
MDTTAIGEMSDTVKIGIIRGQTNYTEEECIKLLVEHNGNYINIIKLFMGIRIDKKEPPIKSVNQEIYKQFRRKLDIQQLNELGK